MSYLDKPLNLALALLWVGGLPQVTATWDPVSGKSYYHLQRFRPDQAIGGGYTFGARILGESYQIPDLDPEEDWFFRVVAYDAQGVPGYLSDPVRITLPAADPGEPDPDPGEPPAAQPGDPPLPPLNLRVAPVAGQNATTLTWDKRANAKYHRIYRLEDYAYHETPASRGGFIAQVAGNVTSFTVQGAAWWTGGTQVFVTTVADVDMDGETMEMESMPCAQGFLYGGFNPWPDARTPAAPTNVRVTPQWNKDEPQNLVTWDSNQTLLFNVYRGGQLVAAGVNRLEYIDRNVTPGQSYTYSVAGVLLKASGGQTSLAASGQSAGVSATTRTGPPQALNNAVTAEAVRAGSNCVLIRVTAPELLGAVDVRAYPSSVAPYEGSKYGGMRDAGEGPWAYIELNGMPNGVPTQYTVEWIDKLGPFMRHEKEFPGHSLKHTNGHGDPGNVPHVLASATLTVTAARLSLTGTQQFYPDLGSFPANFGLAATTVDQSIALAHARSHPVPLGDGLLRQYINGSSGNGFVVRALRVDQVTTVPAFIGAMHLMWGQADGGSASATETTRHNNNATLGFQPRQSWTLSGSDVLEMALFIDSRVTGMNRRWLNYLIFASDLTDPDEQFFKVPTSDGVFLRLSIFNNTHTINWGLGPGGSMSGQRTVTAYRPPTINGTQSHFDRRKHVRVLYQHSTRRFQTWEDGVKISDAVAVGLPMTNAGLKVSFDAQVYHTGLDTAHNLEFGNSYEKYHLNRRPHTDERHVQDLYVQVLSGFPG